MSAAPVPSTRTRRLATVVGLVIPSALIAVSVAIMLIALPTAPAEVIINWGVDGDDRTGPAWTFPVVTAVIGGGVTVLLWATGIRGRRVTDSTVLLAGVALGVAALLAILSPWMLIAQPEDALVPLVTGLATAFGLGVAAWFVLPRDPAVARDRVVADPIVQPRGARSVWTAVARMPLGARVGIAALILLSVLVVVLVVILDGSSGWWLATVPVVLTIAVLTTTEFRVSAGPAGLVVRSPVGWPVFRVPAADIERVDVVAVDPMADFGGWGLRLGLAREGAPRRAFGVVLRRGEAFEVIRRDGRRLVVTIDDAATGAAVLAAASEGAAAVR